MKTQYLKVQAPAWSGDGLVDIAWYSITDEGTLAVWSNGAIMSFYVCPIEQDIANGYQHTAITRDEFENRLNMAIKKFIP